MPQPRPGLPIGRAWTRVGGISVARVQRSVARISGNAVVAGSSAAHVPSDVPVGLSSSGAMIVIAFTLVTVVFIGAAAALAVMRNRQEERASREQEATADAEKLLPRRPASPVTVIFDINEHKSKPGWQKAGATRLEQWVDRVKTTAQRPTKPQRRIVISRPIRPASQASQESHRTARTDPGPSLAAGPPRAELPSRPSLESEDLGTRRPPFQPLRGRSSTLPSRRPDVDGHPARRPDSIYSEAESVESAATIGALPPTLRPNPRLEQLAPRRISLNTKLRQLERSKQMFRKPVAAAPALDLEEFV